MWSLLKQPLVCIRFGRFEFSPRLVTTITVMLLMPVLLGLGHWQLNRGTEKAQRQLLLAERGRAEPMGLDRLTSLAGRGEDIRYYSARLTGRFENQRSILLDNQPHDGRPGYHVLTPLVVGSGLVLVNRGWVPADPDRRRLPVIPPIEGQISVLGRVQVPESGFRLGDSVVENEAFPLRVLQLDLAELKTRLGPELRGFVLQLDPKEPNGFLRDWQVGGLNPERHFGYAIQWFALGTLLVLIYFVTNTHRVENKNNA